MSQQFSLDPLRTPSGLRLLEPEILELSMENPEGLIIIDETLVAERLSHLASIFSDHPAPVDSPVAAGKIIVPTESVGRQRLLQTLHRLGARFYSQSLAALRRLERINTTDSCLTEAEEKLLQSLEAPLQNQSRKHQNVLVRTCRQARAVIDRQSNNTRHPISLIVSLSQDHPTLEEKSQCDPASPQSWPHRGLTASELDCLIRHCQPVNRDSGLLLAGIHVNLDDHLKGSLEAFFETIAQTWKRLPSPFGVGTAPSLIVESAQEPKELELLLKPVLSVIGAAKDSVCLLWRGNPLVGAAFAVQQPCPIESPQILPYQWNPACTVGTAEYLLEISGEIQLVRRAFDPLFSLSFEP